MEKLLETKVEINWKEVALFLIECQIATTDQTNQKSSASKAEKLRNRSILTIIKDAIHKDNYNLLNRNCDERTIFGEVDRILEERE